MTGNDLESNVVKNYHPRIKTNDEIIYEFDLSELTVVENIVVPYFNGGKILVAGMVMGAGDIIRLQIYGSVKTSIQVKSDFKTHFIKFSRSTSQRTRLFG